MNWEQLAANLINWAATEGVKIVIAFAILFISFVIILRILVLLIRHR